jgi:hypothetical protein
MSILQIITTEPGQINTPNVRRVKIISTDNLATVTTASYLNNVTLQGYTIYPTDIIDMWYSWVPSTNTGVYAVFLPTFTLTQITLVEWANPGNVLLPVVTGDVASFNGTTGQITDSGVLATNIVTKNSVNTMAAGSEIIFAKGTGTEAAHAVTINQQSGVITSSTLTTAGGASYLITLTNSFAAATSVVLVDSNGGTNTTQNYTLTAVPSAGSVAITIYNNTAATALNGTIVISFLII